MLVRNGTVTSFNPQPMTLAALAERSGPPRASSRVEFSPGWEELVTSFFSALDPLKRDGKIHHTLKDQRGQEANLGNCWLDEAMIGGCCLVKLLAVEDDQRTARLVAQKAFTNHAEIFFPGTPWVEAQIRPTFVAEVIEWLRSLEGATLPQ